MKLDAWRAGGAHHAGLWHRIEGDGPCTTFCHGFPMTSFDWVHVVPHLKPGRRLFVDHLGFGASEQPKDITIDGQVDALVALWRHRGIEETALVTHDYSVSIALEILARIQEDRWDGPSIRHVTFLNGGMFFSVQKPLMIQRILRGPLGPIATHLVSKRTYMRSMRRILHQWPGDDVMQAQWDAIAPSVKIVHRISKYHHQRRKQEMRWRAAFRASAVPTRMLWGMQDPISGADMVEAARRQGAPAITRWQDVGHDPMLEVPQRVAAALNR